MIVRFEKSVDGTVFIHSISFSFEPKIPFTFCLGQRLKITDHNTLVMSSIDTILDAIDPSPSEIDDWVEYEEQMIQLTSSVEARRVKKEVQHG